MKLVISDVDGTLAKDDKSIPEEFFKIAHKLKSQGVRFGIASGRQYAKLYSTFKDLGDDTFYLAENGALIYEGQKLLKSSCLSDEVAIKACNKTLGHDHLKCYVAGLKASYVISNDPKIYKEVSLYCENLLTLDNYEELKDKGPFLKVSILDLSHEALKSYELFKDLEALANVVVSGNRWIDVNSFDATKGKALAYIKERYGYRYEDCVAFGDYGNDVALLKEAYYSYAMDNGTKEVKNTARFLCPSNNDEGVIKTLKKLYHLC